MLEEKERRRWKGNMITRKMSREKMEQNREKGMGVVFIYVHIGV